MAFLIRHFQDRAADTNAEMEADIVTIPRMKRSGRAGGEECHMNTNVPENDAIRHARVIVKRHGGRDEIDRNDNR